MKLMEGFHPVQLYVNQVLRSLKSVHLTCPSISMGSLNKAGHEEWARIYSQGILHFFHLKSSHWRSGISSFQSREHCNLAPCLLTSCPSPPRKARDQITVLQGLECSNLVPCLQMPFEQKMKQRVYWEQLHCILHFLFVKEQCAASEGRSYTKLT